MSHSPFNPTNDPHAESGHDIARVYRGISVFRVRRDRKWDYRKVMQAENSASRWLLRIYARRFARNQDVLDVHIPDITTLKSSLIEEKGDKGRKYDHLVFQYDVTSGWAKGFVCYAATFSLPDEPEVPPFIEALQGMMTEARAARERRNGAPLN